MRRVFRTELDPSVVTWMSRWQVELGNKKDQLNFNLDNFWKDKRDTLKLKTALAALKAMARPKGGCMYCLVSHGTDIDHFFPKKPYYEKAFQWANYVLCCSDCGRNKSNNLELDTDGNPFLVNPVEENPWNYLEFEPVTGIISARYIVEGNPKGEATAEFLDIESKQWHFEKYIGSYERIKIEIELFLQNPVVSPSTLFESLLLADEQDILERILLHNGSKEPFCLAMQNHHPEVWNYLIEMYIQTFLTQP